MPDARAGVDTPRARCYARRSNQRAPPREFPLEKDFLDV